MISFMRYINVSKISFLLIILFYCKLGLTDQEAHIFSKSEIIIAFGSCNDQTRTQKFWKNIQSQNPDFFVMLGDNVYPEGTGNEISKLARAYNRLHKNDFYENFINSTRILPIWDDHDFGTNDGGSNFKYKKESRNLFMNFYDFSEKKQLKEREALYYESIISYQNKLIQIIVLDTRYFKSDFKITDKKGVKGKERYIKDYDSKKTILGLKQWSWFKEKLLKKVDLRIIVSSFQVIAADHGWEKWGNFPSEQDKLFSSIKNLNPTQTIILSGDRHIGGIYEENLNNNFKLIEITSSSLNKPLPFKVDATDSKQIGKSISAANFGIMKINWLNKSLSLELKPTLGDILTAEDYLLKYKIILVNN